jgi:hypothetical protein
MNNFGCWGRKRVWQTLGVWMDGWMDGWMDYALSSYISYLSRYNLQLRRTGKGGSIHLIDGKFCTFFIIVSLRSFVAGDVLHDDD